MPLVPMKGMLGWAQRDGYAVPAFDLLNIEWTEALVQAAQDQRAPIILSVAEVHFPYTNLELIGPVIHRAVAQATVPIAVHLDHGVTLSAVARALQCGFSSIMFDASEEPFEENVAIVKQIADLCHSVGISTEAELGHVVGEEGGLSGAEPEESLFTDPEEAREFVERTGVDALAVSIGNVHGAYRGEPRLDFDRLGRIRDATGVPLVLHGGSGISAEDFQRAISLGICKINIYTDMANSAVGKVYQCLQEADGRAKFTHLMEAAKEGVHEVACENIGVFGAAGRCREPTPVCELCGGCSLASPAEEDVVRRATEAVLRRLQGQG